MVLVLLSVKIMLKYVDQNEPIVNASNINFKYMFPYVSHYIFIHGLLHTKKG